MKVDKRKTIVFDEDGNVRAKYTSTPSVFWDIAEHSQNVCLNDVLSVIDRIYNIERKFDASCNSHSSRAVCSDGDKYDERKGVQIASTKSDWKFHNNMKRRYRQYYNYLYKILDEIVELEKFHDRKCKHIERYLEDM